jgi:hypothetical protein
VGLRWRGSRYPAIGVAAVRWVITAVVLGPCLLGCGFLDGPVPLETDETVTGFGHACILMHQVVDVIADPTSGTPVLNEGAVPVRWPKGFTARRAGIETEVLDATGTVVLRTGARYSICPSEYLSGWVVGMVEPCPDCELGYFLD